MSFSAATMLAIALGGGLGSMGRAAVSGLIARRAHPAWGTLAVNASGAMAIGAGYAVSQLLADRPGPIPSWPMPLWDIFAIGLLGGYTTVSSYALHSLELARRNGRGAAAANALGSPLVCLVAAGIGAALVDWAAR